MKGIIIASFGSIYQDAVEKSIGSIEKKVRSMYSDMEVRRVFLSDALVEKWNEKYDEKISSFTEAMQDFARMGICVSMSCTFNLLHWWQISVTNKCANKH